MKTLHHHYKDFTEYLQRCRGKCTLAPDFFSLCAEIKVCPLTMNEILIAEMGMRGESIIKEFNKVMQ